MYRLLFVFFVSMIGLGIEPLAAQARPEIRWEPYAFRLRDGTDLAAERGRMMVPEDRADPRSRRIEIGVVRFHSTAVRPGHPIVYLAGGPGGSGVGTARGPRQPVFLALRGVADVILLDQRGTGFSNHIEPCTAARPLDPNLVLTEAVLSAYYRETLTMCMTRWRAAGVATGGYTTNQSADDIDDLRRALGAPKVDLWGTSYGSHLALATMRRHASSIGRVAISSVEGLDQTVKLPAHIDAVYGRIGQAIGMDLPAQMRRVHARMDAAPFTFTVGGDAARSFRADSFVIRRLASGSASNPGGIPRLVSGYAALDAGETAPLAEMLWNAFYREPLTMTGMPELMDIASGVTARRLALIDRQSRSSLLARAVNFPMPQLRGAVPGLDLGDGFRRELRSSLPVLLFEGDLDTRTPLEEQAVATAGLSRAQRIRFVNGGHDLFEAHPQVAEILTAFFSGRPVTVRELRLPAPSSGR